MGVTPEAISLKFKTQTNPLEAMSVKLMGIDVENCLPIIHAQMLRKTAPGIKFDAISRYVQNRDDVLGEIMPSVGNRFIELTG